MKEKDGDKKKLSAEEIKAIKEKSAKKQKSAQDGKVIKKQND